METSIAKPSTLGEILKHEFLEPMNITAETLCEETGLDVEKVNQVIVNNAFITESEAQELALFFDTDLDFWKNIQDAYRGWIAKHG